MINKLKFISIPLLGIILITALLGIIFARNSQPVEAASGNDFNAGRIIDDAVFYNSNAIDANQVQAFLNAKVPNCDTYGTGTAREWGSSLTRAQYANYMYTNKIGNNWQRWHQPPYTCLKDYGQNTPQMEAASGLCGPMSAGYRTGAQVINDVAKACGINPQVLVVLLDKEQSLVTDIWPLQAQYKDATGFGCPDTAACDPAYEGFFYQVYYAARQFKVYKAYPNSYNYIAGRTNRIYWNPDTARCGSSQVYIENQATAALYIYTPYRPNQAALNNMYGTGDSCSAYGNRNFWRLFTDWFGNTLAYSVIPELTTRYAALGGVNGSLGVVVDGGFCNNDRSACWQGFRNGTLIYSPATGAWESTGSIREYWGKTGYQTGILGYPAGSEVYDGKGWWQTYQNGAIIGTPQTGFWESMGPIRERWGQLGYQGGVLGYPISKITTSPDSKTSWQEYQKGFIIWNVTTGAWASTGSIREYWGKTGYQTGNLGYPIGPEVFDGKGWWQSYQNGVIIGTPETGFWESAGPVRERWGQLGYQTSNIGYPISSLRTSADGKTAWQQYQNGYIIWGATSGAWESQGSIREYWAQLGYQNGRAGFPTGPETYNSQTTTWSQTYQNGVISYSGITRTGSFIPK